MTKFNNVSPQTRAFMQGISANEAPTHYFDKNPNINGIIQSLGSKQTRKGDHVGWIIIESADYQLSKVWVSHKLLQKAFKESPAMPEPNDYISIEMTGKQMQESGREALTWKLHITKQDIVEGQEV